MHISPFFFKALKDLIKLAYHSFTSLRKHGLKQKRFFNMQCYIISHLLTPEIVLFYQTTRKSSSKIVTATFGKCMPHNYSKPFRQFSVCEISFFNVLYFCCIFMNCLVWPCLNLQGFIFSCILIGVT